MAYLLKVLLPHKTSMLIWDVYPDLFKITGMKESHPFFRTWAFLNRIVFKRAFKLYTIGDRMAGLLAKYVDRKKINVTPIWSIFQSNGKVAKEENPFVSEQNIQDKFVVQYSGNIGLTHNVEVLVEIADRMKKYDKIMFQIIGKGDRVSFLRQMAKEKKLTNCQFLPFQSDEMFQFSLSAADLGVVILDDVTSKGSVPSKSYNLMSFGIPSLYIAADDSELHDYAGRYNHAKCFQKDDLESAINFISGLSDDEELYKKYSQNALDAADNYKRSNADKIVELYLTE
jgi:glycosyltransferase involved in cell wall biosynthesis